MKLFHFRIFMLRIDFDKKKHLKLQKILPQIIEWFRILSILNW